MRKRETESSPLNALSAADGKRRGRQARPPISDLSGERQVVSQRHRDPKRNKIQNIRFRCLPSSFLPYPIASMTPLPEIRPGCSPAETLGKYRIFDPAPRVPQVRPRPADGLVPVRPARTLISSSVSIVAPGLVYGPKS